jgi:hypothetical protein
MDTSLKSSTIIHHLPSTYATIVDLLADSNIKDLLPSVLQEDTKPCWPLLMCDHVGKMSITLVSADESQPIILPLDSPHSETLRAATTHRSSLYTCGDDGQLVQWEPSSSNNFNKNQQQTKPNKQSNSRRPY